MTSSTEKVAVPARFIELVQMVTQAIAGHALDEALEALLDKEFPANGPWFTTMEQALRQGCAEGWLCAREQDGIKFGRPVKHGPSSHGFSVDVVEMNDMVGPHHSHPNGEIDLIVPIDADARFDGRPRGWKVYGPGSAHRPTVSGGKALILYLLPEGAIVFSQG